MDKINIDNFVAQRDKPITQKKIDAIVDNLYIEYLFIKEEYYLAKKSIKCSVQELYQQYCYYCTINQKHPLHKIKFNERLFNIGIRFYKSNGHNKYKCSWEELKIIATKNKWNHELDEFECVNKPEENDKYDIDHDMLDGVAEHEELDDAHEEIKRLNKLIEKLQEEDNKKQSYLEIIHNELLKYRRGEVQQLKTKLQKPKSKQMPTQIDNLDDCEEEPKQTDNLDDCNNYYFHLFYD
jgi:hypothetical protein